MRPLHDRDEENGRENAAFTGCKMLGVHFEYCNRLSFSAAFEECILNLSSFYRLSMKKTIFRKCSLQEVDFAECDLSGSLFDNCDLSKAKFDRTTLRKADFERRTTIPSIPKTMM